MRRSGWAALVGVAATALAAAGAAGQARTAFTERDAGRDLRLGALAFGVDLPRSAGTGYRWEFMGGSDVLLVGRTTDAAPGARPGVVGAPAVDRFALRATGPVGQVEIGLFPPGSPGAPARIWRATFHAAYADGAPLPDTSLDLRQ